MKTRWLTTRQAAERAGIPLSSFRLMMAKGQVPFHRYGPRTIRFNEQDLEAWIACRKINATIDAAMADQRDSTVGSSQG